ncbi:MAG: hypothetical protein PHV36_10575 [Elusimicrobiales bacterium]|nr:hypothetical protein [Elusimicrobiales bacterium]
MKKFLLAAGFTMLLTQGVCDAKPRFPGDKTPPAKPGIDDPQKKKNDAMINSGSIFDVLDNDSFTLYYDQAALINRVKDIQTFLSVSASVLGVLTTVDSDLIKLETSIKTLYGAAETATAIPQSREKAQKIKDTLAVTLKNITAARQRMDAIVTKTEPVRAKMATAAARARVLEYGLIGLNDGVVANIPRAISGIKTCIKSLPEDKRTCADDNMAPIAYKVSTVVVEYDRVVKVLIYTPDIWLPSMNFFDPFNADMLAVDKLRDDIEALYKRVEKLSAELSVLNGVLNQSFSFSFRYPNPTVTNPVRMSTYDVSISFRTIIQGANAIQDTIRSVLSNFLWNILKDLGVDKYVNSLVNQANGAVNALMNLVGFDVDLNLPNMSALDPFGAMEAKLEADLDALKFPSVSADLPGFGFPGFNADIDLKLLSGAFPSACSAEAFGCGN